MSDYPTTPELDKILAHQDMSQAIGSFIAWLATEARFGPTRGVGRRAAVKATKLNASPVRLCLFDEDRDEWIPSHLRIEEMLAKYFEIDLDKVEQERSAVLAYVRKQNEEQA